MPEVPPIWDSSVRKEAFDLLTTVWREANDEIREELETVIAAGPPDLILERIELEEREISRDRRIFDRLVLLERSGVAPFSRELRAEAERLHKKYPEWQLREGEQAHFAIWSEASFGSDASLSLGELRSLNNDEIVERLGHQNEQREGILDQWRQLATSEPARTIDLFQQLPVLPRARIIQILEYQLWGLRDAAKSFESPSVLLSFLTAIPPEILRNPSVSGRAADVLEALSERPEIDVEFWRAFDRILPAVAQDPDNRDVPRDDDWVSLAINRSMGRIATAFLAGLFKRRLKVGARIPRDLKLRLNRLVNVRRRGHRPARVIAASRLSYLYAVDPDWATRYLIPLFNWDRAQEEALAAWQGYSWAPRIDRKLWAALKPFFLQSFTTVRLNLLGDSVRSIAQILMLVGIEFGPSELPREATRNAIRSMSDEMRSEAISWIGSYISQRDDAQSDALGARGADALWTEHVRPWLDRVWPPDPQLRSETVASKFTLMAIRTNDSFPDAVSFVLPHLVPTGAHFEIHELAESNHPDRHPVRTLDLINGIVDPIRHWYDDGDLRGILNRIVHAEPEVANSNTYRDWDERLRAQQIAP